MKIKDIVELACIFLSKDEIDESLFNSANVDQNEIESNKELKLLIRCANLVYKEVASDYLPLQYIETFNTADGIIKFTDFRHIVKDVIFITDKNGNKVRFYVFPDSIETVKGEVKVHINYIPNSVGFADDIDYKSSQISDRVFAYGAACEYCVISGLYEDAAIWERRYKDSLLSCCRKKAEIKMPKRAWL